MFHPRAALTTPRAVTSSHLVTMAFHESLDVAERDALLDMVRWLHAIVQPAGGGVTRTQLYRAASLVADMRVTQVVNVKKGAFILIFVWSIRMTSLFIYRCAWFRRAVCAPSSASSEGSPPT